LQLRASDLAHAPARVSFQVDVFRGVGNWNLLGPIDRGVVSAADEPEGLRISYDLSFRRLFLFVSGGILLIFAPVVFLANVPVAWPVRAAALFAMWGWVFGGNYVSSAVRFPRFVRRALAGDVWKICTRRSWASPSLSRRRYALPWRPPNVSLLLTSRTWALGGQRGSMRGGYDE
jgi:hypothetical protein